MTALKLWLQNWSHFCGHVSVEILLFNAKLILKQDEMVAKLGPVLFGCRGSCELS